MVQVKYSHPNNPGSQYTIVVSGTIPTVSKRITMRGFTVESARVVFPYWVELMNEHGKVVSGCIYYGATAEEVQASAEDDCFQVKYYDYSIRVTHFE